MAFSDVFLIVPTSPLISGLIWFFGLTVLFYLARQHAHHGITAFCRTLHNGFRLTARSVQKAEARLMNRNREVLLAQGREAAERMIEREFERVDATVRRELSDYPALHRKLSEEITHIDENYKESTEVPPEPPAWVKAVEAVAKIPSTKGDPTVSNILEDIHDSLKKSSTRALEEYRKASSIRHQFLQKMMPHWRKVLSILQQVDKSVNSLIARSITLDRHMDEYEQIVKGTDRAVRTLSSSSMTQFFISGFVLAIAVGGAIINFNLIARPMAEMVGGTSLLMGFKTANIAAMVIILVEISLGLFLMESLRITRLFPVIGALNDKMRIKMVWITFIFLFCLASVEAGLAYMREILMQDAAATRALLRDDGAAEVVQNSHLWITTASQMGMGFILPFALTFVAIPLESFIHSTRTVLGVVAVSFLRSLNWVLRLIGNAIMSSGRVIIHLYDFFIFIPLWIEKVMDLKKQNKKSESSKVNYGGAA